MHSPRRGSRRWRALGAATLPWALALIAGCGTDSLAVSGDAGVDRDGGGRDASAGADARAGVDASPPPGVRVAELPADLVAVPEGSDEVLFLRAGTLMRVRADGTRPESLSIRPNAGFGPTPSLWLWSEVDDDDSIGALSVYTPGGAPSTTALAPRSATDVFGVDADGTVAIAAVDVAVVGNAASSTRSASLARITADGDVRVLLRGLTLGRWDARTKQHVCGPQVAVMSPTRALAVVCPEPGRDTRVLVALDLVTGSTATVARDVVPFLRASEDGTFALFADRQLAFYGTSAAGDRVVPLGEPGRITSIGFVGGPRLTYTTSGQDLWACAWPTLIPSPLLPRGVEAIEALSPDGAWLMFRQARAPSGLRDLYLVATATVPPPSPRVLAADPDAYPGDDAFSEDGQWAHWFARADANFIGDIVIAPTADGAPRTVAERGWIVQNAADASQLALLINARFTGDGRRLVADLAVAPRDGSAPPRVLVSGLDTSAFELFPEGDRAAFRVSEGAHPGLWVRALDR